MTLPGAECERLVEVLAQTCCDAPGTCAIIPWTDICRRLAGGLEAVDGDTGRRHPLGRGDASRLAAPAICTLLRDGRAD